MIIAIVATAIVVAIVIYGVRQFRVLSPQLRNVIQSARQRKGVRALGAIPQKELMTRAHAGDSSAQYALGLKYAKGTDVALDYEKSNYWLQRAAEASSMDAAYCLGLHFENGRGVARDLSMAATWYRKAADAGHADAQCNLGALLSGGNGATKFVWAAYWFVQAFARGQRVASENLEWLKRQKIEFDAHERDDLTKLETLARNGDRDALLFIGWTHENGFGMPIDLTKALSYYQAAQRNGNLFAHELRAQLEAKHHI